MTASGLDVRRIPLSLVDEPPLTMRETMDEGKLAELVESIKVNGLINPIVLRPRGGRFEIIAGHRRYLACVKAGILDPPCIVRDLDANAVERMKLAENIDREDVNPAEEASYLAELLSRFCHDDTDELCDLTHRNRAYVESRLLLLRGAPEVLAALRAGEINLSVATELNRFPDRTGLLMHLEPAKAGATARQVKQWLVDYKNFRARQEGALSDGQAAPAYVAPMPDPPKPSCICCRETTDQHLLIAVYVHSHCQKAILERMLRAYHGDAAAVGA